MLMPKLAIHALDGNASEKVEINELGPNGEALTCDSTVSRPVEQVWFKNRRTSAMLKALRERCRHGAADSRGSLVA